MIALDQIRVSLAGKLLVGPLSLEIPSVGLVSLQGPSGSGKTTLLRALAGLLPIDGGRLIGWQPERVRMVFQDDRLLPWMTVLQNLSCFFANEATAWLWLERLDLVDSARLVPDQLSGGMRRRLALARGLGSPAELLLLDEPFTGLDRDWIDRLVPWITAAASDRAVVMVSHVPLPPALRVDRLYTVDGPPLRRVDRNVTTAASTAASTAAFAAASNAATTAASTDAFTTASTAATTSSSD